MLFFHLLYVLNTYWLDILFSRKTTKRGGAFMVYYWKNFALKVHFYCSNFIYRPLSGRFIGIGNLKQSKIPKYFYITHWNQYILTWWGAIGKTWYDSVSVTCGRLVCGFLSIVQWFPLPITPCYSWNTATVSIKHKSINQSINQPLPLNWL